MQQEEEAKRDDLDQLKTKKIKDESKADNLK